MEENEKKYIKCKCKLRFRIFPRGDFTPGSWCALSMVVTETIEGEVKTDLKDCAKFVGTIYELKDNEEYTILAEEENDPKYGTQYRILYIGQPVNLDTVEEQQIYLLNVITEKQVANLYATLENPYDDILNCRVENLIKVKGIGEETAKRIINKVMSNLDHAKAYIELDGLDITKDLIDKLVGIYHSPEAVVHILKKMPYKLIDDVAGIGFKKADEIALANGFDENDKMRLEYLAEYVLENEANEGNSWLYAEQFLSKVEETTNYLDEDAFCDMIVENPQGKFYTFDKGEDRCIALYKNYNLEKNIAKELLRIKNGNNHFDYGNWQEKIKQVESKQGFNFTEEQILAIKGFMKCNVGVLTAFGGTGKSTTVNGLVAILDDYLVAQTALSGRAAARMGEITGQQDYTIHTLLGYDPRLGGFIHNKENPLDADIIIVDEVSMIGGEIFYDLLKAVRTGAKLIMLGDTGQLEAIGKMNILHDLVDCGVIPAYKLTKIHRQALESGIIEASMKVRNQEQLFNKSFDDAFVIGKLQDCFFDITLDKSNLVKMISDYFEELIKENDIKEVQVIVPNNTRGDLSCKNLNPILQDIYNPQINQKRLLIGNGEFRVGDKVINRKNNRKLVNDKGVITPIYNGDLGIVVDVDVSRMRILVDFENKGNVWIEDEQLFYLYLGYCITTHSSQGSQYNHVVYGLDYGAYTLLNKEQVYTAITRAKESCTICSETRALIKAIATTQVNKKQTFLCDLLQELDNNNIGK